MAMIGIVKTESGRVGQIVDRTTEGNYLVSWGDVEAGGPVEVKPEDVTVSFTPVAGSNAKTHQEEVDEITKYLLKKNKNLYARFAAGTRQNDSSSNL